MSEESKTKLGSRLGHFDGSVAERYKTSLFVTLQHKLCWLPPHDGYFDGSKVFLGPNHSASHVRNSCIVQPGHWCLAQGVLQVFFFSMLVLGGAKGT